MKAPGGHGLNLESITLIKNPKEKQHPFVSEMDQELSVVLTVDPCLLVLTSRTHDGEHQIHIKRNREKHRDREDEGGHLTSC